jgi:hypothetical protein
MATYDPPQPLWNTHVRIDPTVVPAEIDRWNWGAFLLNWIWGVGNNTFVALLTLIPFFGILIMPFVLGAKGNAWAWRNGRWDSIEHFKRVQRLWAIWGVIVWLGFRCLAALFTFSDTPKPTNSPHPNFRTVLKRPMFSVPRYLLACR